MLTLGIDEAGRGSVLGPMILCGVWLDPQAATKLKSIGVTDSKKTCKARRARLAPKIRKAAAAVSILKVENTEIDNAVRRTSLDQLEREVAARIIRNGPKANKIILDGKRIFNKLTKANSIIIALDKADMKEIAVAAASILAKVERDASFISLVRELAPDMEPVSGGGYPNKYTELFLRSYVSKYGELPKTVRLSWDWKPLKQILRKLPN